MKKNGVEKPTKVKKTKKLQLFRETLRALTSTDAQMVVGGFDLDSCESGCHRCCPSYDCGTS
ncbi:MAG: hypothetical protein ABUT39_25935 [Acidobacteriota bacterium]